MSIWLRGRFEDALMLEIDRDVKPYSVVGGTPARLIRKRDDPQMHAGMSLRV